MHTGHGCGGANGGCTLRFASFVAGIRSRPEFIGVGLSKKGEAEFCFTWVFGMGGKRAGISGFGMLVMGVRVGFDVVVAASACDFFVEARSIIDMISPLSRARTWYIRIPPGRGLIDSIKQRLSGLPFSLISTT